LEGQHVCASMRSFTRNPVAGVRGFNVETAELVGFQHAEGWRVDVIVDQIFTGDIRLADLRMSGSSEPVRPTARSHDGLVAQTVFSVHSKSRFHRRHSCTTTRRAIRCDRE